MDWPADSTWRAVVSAALVGTERQPFKPLTASGTLGQVLTALTHQPTEGALLKAVAAISLHQQAGWLPENDVSPKQEPCPVDQWPRCSARASRFLQHILQGQYAQLLPEWLAAATRFQHRVPEMLLPQLLDLGRQQRDLRAAILPVLGQRGRWLANQNADWRYAVEVATTADWETGAMAARSLYLKELRSQDPDRARDLLAATWSQEPAGDRTKFLETFQVGLSLEDEPFLEEALRDRSKEVRRIAADLLARLPQSRLCQRMASQVQKYISFNPGDSSGLTIRLPDSLDPALVQDGVEAKPTPLATKQVGEKAWWLLQMVGATPLNTWNETWEVPAIDIVLAAKNHEWEAALLDGWALATQRQQNAQWAKALLEVWLAEAATRTAVVPEVRLNTLLNILPIEQQNGVLVAFLKSARGHLNDSTTLWLLRSLNSWGAKLAETVLNALEDYLSQNSLATTLPWGLLSALKEFGQFIPIECLPRVVQLRESLPPESLWIAGTEELLALLRFRQDMLQAFELPDSG